MHTAILGQSIAYFGVAIQTFELRPAGAEIVAFRTAQDAGKRLVCFSEGTRRNLSSGRSRNKEERQRGEN